MQDRHDLAAHSDADVVLAEVRKVVGEQPLRAREVLRALARNATIWYAPDQARIDSGELLPFFGEPCMVSTAASRIARLSGAAIVPFFYCRTDDDSGYVLRFHAPLPGIPSGDAIEDTRRLMAVLEDFVRQCPDQYHWMHRKFKDRRGDLRDAYADG